MKKIKVLEFSNQWSMGGGEHTFQLFIKHLDKEKFDVTAAGWNGGPRLDKIKDMYGLPTFVEPDKTKMIAWMKTQNFDIVHFLRMGVTESILIDTFTEAGIPILIEHNAFGLFDPTADRTKIHRHVMCSKSTAQIYSQRAAVFYEESKISQVYCPVDRELFESYDFSKRDWNAPIFGKYGRKDATKWHPITFHMLPIIKKEVPEAKFYTMGLPDEYRPLLKENDVEDMIVEFPSNTDDKDMLDFLNKITIFTHANVYGESFGCCIAESMASGLPVTTHTGGDSAQFELITHDHNGLVANIGTNGPGQPIPMTKENIHAYAMNVVKLLKNPELKKTMGERGRERSFDWFAGATVTKKLEETFLEEYNKMNVKKNPNLKFMSEIIK